MPSGYFIVWGDSATCKAIINFIYLLVVGYMGGGMGHSLLLVYTIGLYTLCTYINRISLLHQYQLHTDSNPFHYFRGAPFDFQRRHGIGVR